MVSRSLRKLLFITASCLATQNVASRMESTGAPGAIHVSEDTQALAAPYMPLSYGSGSTAAQPGAGGDVTWQRREAVPIKGRGTLNTYWLLPAGETSPPEAYQKQLQQQYKLY